MWGDGEWKARGLLCEAGFEALIERRLTTFTLNSESRQVSSLNNGVQQSPQVKAGLKRGNLVASQLLPVEGFVRPSDTE